MTNITVIKIYFCHESISWAAGHAIHCKSAPPRRIRAFRSYRCRVWWVVYWIGEYGVENGCRVRIEVDGWYMNCGVNNFSIL
jgi:hypothetical protein